MDPPSGADALGPAVLRVHRGHVDPLYATVSAARPSKASTPQPDRTRNPTWYLTEGLT